MCLRELSNEHWLFAATACYHLPTDAHPDQEPRTYQQRTKNQGHVSTQYSNPLQRMDPCMHASPWTHAWIDSIFCCDCMLSFARRSNHGPRTNADGFKTKNQGHVSTQYSNPLQRMDPCMHGCYFLLRQLCHCVAKTTTKRAMGKEPRTIARAKDM